MRIQSFHHVAVSVEDVARAARFYTGVLGLPEQARSHHEDGTLRSVWVGLPDGSFVALEKASAPRPAASFSDKPGAIHLLAFKIRREEREGWLRTFAEHGVQVVHQSRWTVYVEDPEGNRLGLSHHPFDPA